MSICTFGTHMKAKNYTGEWRLNPCQATRFVAMNWNEMARSSVAFIRGVFEPFEFCFVFSRPKLIWFRHVGQAAERRITSYAVTWLWLWYSHNGRYNELYECAHNREESVGGCLVETVPVGQGLRRVLRFSPVGFIPPVHHRMYRIYNRFETLKPRCM